MRALAIVATACGALASSDVCVLVQEASLFAQHSATLEAALQAQQLPGGDGSLTCAHVPAAVAQLTKQAAAASKAATKEDSRLQAALAAQRASRQDASTVSYTHPEPTRPY